MKRFVFAVVFMMLTWSLAGAKRDCITVLSSQEVVGYCIVSTYQTCCADTKCFQWTQTDCYSRSNK